MVKEIVEFEVGIDGCPDRDYWSTTILIDYDDPWTQFATNDEVRYKAAVRWITNLCGTLLKTDINPVGPIRMRTAEFAIYDAEHDNLNLPEYKYYGTIAEKMWKQ